MSATESEDTPRDVRLLHLLLASQAIHQYEDNVPLQLIDFANRYTRNVLKDAIMYNDYMENNSVNHNTNSTNSMNNINTNLTNNNPTSTNDDDNNNSASTNQTNDSSSNTGQLTMEDIRLAIAARTQYQFKPTAPKELLLQLANERNKKNLPQVLGSWGIRLPPEKYCLTARDRE